MKISRVRTVPSMVAYRDQLQADQFGNFVNIVALAKDTEEEGNRIADVADNHLKRQWWVSNVEEMTPPGKKGIAQTDEGNDA